MMRFNHLRLHTRRRPAAMVPRRRSGMTLVEIIVAMLLMTGVLLSLGGFTYKFSRSASQAHLVILANELAVKRLDDMRQQPNYLSLFALNKTGRTVVADNRTFTESTYVLRTGGGVKDLTDYATITVVILNPAMTKRITKTSALAAF